MNEELEKTGAGRESLRGRWTLRARGEKKMKDKDFEILAQGLGERLTDVSTRVSEAVSKARKEVEAARDEAMRAVQSATNREAVIRVRENFKSAVNSSLTVAKMALSHESDIVLNSRGGNIANWLTQELNKRIV
jgi:hypothetical protein